MYGTELGLPAYLSTDSYFYKKIFKRWPIHFYSISAVEIITAAKYRFGNNMNLLIKEVACII